ncbi:hypothetical protein ACCS70_20305 [Rhizobium ruizarguesonis]|jgi:hypothetical protein|uniref:hypothetical protein n=1 Tax=Rhizobium TaxID=379 RepID=UPI001031687B|nr:hypothetical protein [Rhizobium ruizarguesonis]NEH34882.1 hypothetical protein [Rhizobium ruizarguesonis]NEI78707.1 hypothetical protein [Rhizobium ruizarguesonis]TAW77288.1 hypothetical protein ELI10_08810 [Rhizobium ruizarguesonis]TAX14254.1 hypothetical protein ELI09_08870 [Rhizobium ruizarguesonis]TAX19086.1 hypothetical protein ELI08_08870 [Rhizobium ruizarguesonis]
MAIDLSAFEIDLRDKLDRAIDARDKTISADEQTFLTLTLYLIRVLNSAFSIIDLKQDPDYQLEWEGPYISEPPKYGHGLDISMRAYNKTLAITMFWEGSPSQTVAIDLHSDYHHFFTNVTNAVAEDQDSLKIPHTSKNDELAQSFVALITNFYS